MNPTINSGRSESPTPFEQYEPKDSARQSNFDGRTPAVTTPAYDPIPVPRVAAASHPASTSQQRQAVPSSIDEAKGAWKQRVASAKVTWGKLTDDELLQTQGHMEKLSRVVQERYAITRDEAVTQIKTFFSQFKPDRGIR